MLTPASKPKPHPDVVATTLSGGDMILLQLATRQYFSLNSTGARIWQLLQHDHSIAAIAACLLDEFDVGLPEAQDSVMSLIDGMAAANLVLVT